MASTLNCDKCGRKVDKLHTVISELQSKSVKELCDSCMKAASEMHEHLATEAMEKVHAQVKEWLAETHH